MKFTLKWFYKKAVKILLFSILLFVGCSQKPSKNDYNALRKVAIKQSLKHLAYRLPTKKKGYAGIGASKFINGDQIEVGDFEASYKLKGDQSSWQNRIHEVTIKILFFQKKIKDTLIVKYNFKDKNSRTQELALEYVYGLPSKDYFYAFDPLKKFRGKKSRRILAALRRREVFVGMPEKAVMLSWGRPQSITSMESMHGKEQRYTYGRNVLYIRNSKLVRREKL